MNARTVLIVDDDAPIRSLIATALRARGLTSEQAANGEEALVMLRHGQYDIAILDLMMPQVNGLEVLERLGNGEGRRPSFVFVITAAGEELLDRLDPSLVQGVLRKPFDVMLLVDVISALVERDEHDSVHSAPPPRPLRPEHDM